MPVQQLPPPTIAEVEKDIADYERKYNMTTAAFLALTEADPSIDEDDAMEWAYRAEQLAALREANRSSLS